MDGGGGGGSSSSSSSFRLLLFLLFPLHSCHEVGASLTATRSENSAREQWKLRPAGRPQQAAGSRRPAAGGLSKHTCGPSSARPSAHQSDFWPAPRAEIDAAARRAQVKLGPGQRRSAGPPTRSPALVNLQKGFTLVRRQLIRPAGRRANRSRKRWPAQS